MIRSIAATLFLASLSLAVFMPGLGGDFIFDDFPNIVQNESLRETAAALPGIDALQRILLHAPRPVSMLTFAVQLSVGLDSPAQFKAVNIAIHALNAALLFFLLTSLLKELTNLRREHVLAYSLIGAAVWAVHPINLTSVLYIVQRMNSLSAMFVLAGLLFWIRSRSTIPLAARAAVLAVITALAWSSKENGALLPLFVVLYEFAAGRIRERRLLVASVVMVVAAAITLWVSGRAESLLGLYRVREWTPWERLLTQTRVVAGYLEWILVPDIRALGLYHDDVRASTSIISPWTTLPAILLHATLLVTAFLIRRLSPLAAFGLLFFYAGHLVESTVVPIELVHEHRNYLPQVGIWLSLIGALSAWRPALHLRVAVMLGIFVVIVFGGATAVRSLTWQSTPMHIWFEAYHHPQSSRATVELGGVFVDAARKVEDKRIKKDFLDRAARLFDRGFALDPNNFSGAFGYLQIRGSAPSDQDFAYLARVRQAMLTTSYRPNNENLLYEFAICSKAGRCNYGPQRTQDFLESAVQHPTAPVRYRAGAAMVAAMHAHEVLKQDQRALHLITPYAGIIAASRRLCMLHAMLVADMDTRLQRHVAPVSCGTMNRQAGSSGQ